MRIQFLTRSLGCGGAERQLVLMAKALARTHQVEVVTFYSGDNHFAGDLALAPLLHSLDKRGRWDVLPFMTRFVRHLRQTRPDVVYAFMGPASLVALAARAAAPDTRLVWGIRSSNMALDRYDWLAARLRFLECRLSRFADLLISNSEAGRDQALADGFANRQILVIDNGIDTSVFRRRPGAREALAQRLGLPAGTPLVGTIARIDPMKGYEVFLQAAEQLHQALPQVHFVAGGAGAAGYTATLRDQARARGLDQHVHWLGQVDDVSGLYSAVDLYTSASVFGEGFSNAVGEAMACGAPCVVTDVGDAARIVGDTGLVVPAGDAPRLANAWRQLLDLPADARLAWGMRAQQRVVEHFSVHALVRATEAALAGARR